MAKNTLPKRIAGVKVPKRLRKSGGKAVKALRHPLVADFVAAALIAAAAALRGSPKVQKTAKTARKKAGSAAGAIGAKAVTLGTIVAAKAREGAEMMAEAYEGIGTNGSGTRGSSSSSRKSTGKAGAKFGGKKGKKKS